MCPFQRPGAARTYFPLVWARRCNGKDRRRLKKSRPTQRVANSRRRPALASDRFCSDLLPTRARLGPLSTLLLLRVLRTDGIAATVSAAAAAQWGGVAVSRLEGRGVSLRERRKVRPPRGGFTIPRFLLPDPFLGSGASHQPLPAGSNALGPTCRMSGVFRPAVRHITGGGNNPRSPMGVFTRPWCRVALPLAADPRRARIWLLRTALL